MSSGTWKGKPREIFPVPTEENTEDVNKDDFDKLLEEATKAEEVKHEEIEIPPSMLTELVKMDAEINARMQLRQGLWTGCALGLGIDLVKNRAEFDHTRGVITVIPSQA